MSWVTERCRFCFLKSKQLCIFFPPCAFLIVLYMKVIREWDKHVLSACTYSIWWWILIIYPNAALNLSGFQPAVIRRHLSVDGFWWFDRFFDFLKLTIQHSHPPHSEPGRLCGGEKVTWVFFSSFFHSHLDGTAHLNSTFAWFWSDDVSSSRAVFNVEHFICVRLFVFNYLT